MPAAWEPAVERLAELELARHPDARRLYDTDADYRMSLVLHCHALTVVAEIAEQQGFPRFSVEDLVRRAVERVVREGAASAATARRERQQALVELTKPPAYIVEMHQRMLAEDPSYRAYVDWADRVRAMPAPDMQAGPVVYRENGQA